MINSRLSVPNVFADELKKNNNKNKNTFSEAV